MGLTVNKFKVAVELLLAPNCFGKVEESRSLIELSLGLVKSHLRLEDCRGAASGAFMLQEAAVQLRARAKEKRAKMLLCPVVN
jgi:hypothetical protein